MNQSTTSAAGPTPRLSVTDSRRRDQDASGVGLDLITASTGSHAERHTIDPHSHCLGLDRNARRSVEENARPGVSDVRDERRRDFGGRDLGVPTSASFETGGHIPIAASRALPTLTSTL